MEDKLIMNNVLSLTKEMCNLLLHGTIESSTPKIHSTFNDSLNECLEIQNDLYITMTEKGWYQVQQVEDQKITDAKNKFENM